MGMMNKYIFMNISKSMWMGFTALYKLQVDGALDWRESWTDDRVQH